MATLKHTTASNACRAILLVVFVLWLIFVSGEFAVQLVDIKYSKGYYFKTWKLYLEATLKLIQFLFVSATQTVGVLYLAFDSYPYAIMFGIQILFHLLMTFLIHFGVVSTFSNIFNEPPVDLWAILGVAFLYVFNALVLQIYVYLKLDLPTANTYDLTSAEKGGDDHHEEGSSGEEIELKAVVLYPNLPEEPQDNISQRAQSPVPVGGVRVFPDGSSPVRITHQLKG